MDSEDGAHDVFSLMDWRVKVSAYFSVDYCGLDWMFSVLLASLG
jgi:hypothetical protein